MIPKFLQFLLLALISTTSFAYQNSPWYKMSKEKTPEAGNELIEFLKIPNDATKPENIKDNITWLDAAFKKRGFETKVLPTNRTPLFFAEMKAKGALSTLLFYMHFDGQAVDPSKWDQKNPYLAVVKIRKDSHWEKIGNAITEGFDPESRIFGRSASDDKGPIVMLLNAIDLINENNMQLGHNIKIILDGEEEKGSRHLEDAVLKYKDLLTADHMIINDGPMHLSGKPTVIFGCRGNTGINLTVYGPRSHQHSGHYGNYAPNPVFRLSRLLASMKDDDGRVIIPGYYQGIVFDDETKKILADVPDNPEQIHDIIGIAAPEKVGNNYQESLQYPSLNVRGMAAAWIGPETRTIVPAEATASIDVRLVPETPPDRLIGLIKSHIQDQGYYVIDRDPTEKERRQYPKIAKFILGGTNLPFRTDIQSPTGKMISTAINSGLGVDPIKIRTMGGTVPIAKFINALKIPAVIVPLVNADNNQHSPNENLRVGNITNGIATFISIIANNSGAIDPDK